MNKNQYRHIIPIIIIFIIVTAISIIAKDWLIGQGIDPDVLLVGNITLFAVSMLAWFINQRSVRSSNPQSSVRAMYGSFMVKFFVLAVAAFVYIMMTKKEVNKGGLMVCAGLYIIYAVFETRALMRLSKEKKNA
jgi:lysylphosphatidylglycerol synthetase-like protein (DUF2156 family)